jgi:DnaJ-class molecular chaperone
MNNIATDKVNRLEVIDHTKCFHCNGTGDGRHTRICEHCGGRGFPGRTVVVWDNKKKIELSLQDDDRTLKVFISEREV